MQTSGPLPMQHPAAESRPDITIRSQGKTADSETSSKPSPCARLKSAKCGLPDAAAKSSASTSAACSVSARDLREDVVGFVHGRAVLRTQPRVNLLPLLVRQHP